MLILNNKLLNIFFEDLGFSLKEKRIRLLRQRLIYDLIKFLKKKFIVNIEPKNPDYLIYNIFGCNHLKKKYKNCIKIAYFTENQIPDFNVADYGITFSHLSFLDRTFKYSYFKDWFSKIILNNKHLKLIRKSVLKNPKRNKFCAAVISNHDKTSKFRLNFINVGFIKNKIKFLKSYKFSIAMENSEGDGYLSEKLFQSFISGTIPIYYGDYMMDEFVNPKSIILIKGNKDIYKKIAFIKKIDKQQELYEKFLKENIFTNNNNKLIENERYNFFLNIFEQEKSKAKRIDNYQ